MNQLINRAFALIERKLTARWFNPFATLYLNFRTMSFYQAFHLPIYIYGKVKFYNLKGKIDFTCKVRRGLIKMGRHDDIYNHAPFSVLSLDKGCKIIFNGYCSVAAGFIWRISNTGTFNVGKMCWFGNCCRILCSNNIIIGDYSSLTYDCILMDTNSHYTIDTYDYKVKRKEGIIIIGTKNWIGNNCRILKGCKTGCQSIVTSGSMLNKDFSHYNDILLAGTPAQIKYEGINRCFSFAREREIDNYFKTHPQSQYMYFDKNYNDPVEDLIKLFK